MKYSATETELLTHNMYEFKTWQSEFDYVKKT